MRFHVRGCSAIDFGKLKSRRRGCVQMWKRPQEPLLSVFFLEKSCVQEALSLGLQPEMGVALLGGRHRGGSHGFIL